MANKRDETGTDNVLSCGCWIIVLIIIAIVFFSAFDAYVWPALKGAL